MIGQTVGYKWRFPALITPTQCRMGRAALGMPLRELAQAADVSVMTLSAFERGANCRASTLEKIAKTLEDRGVVLISTGSLSAGGGAGVRLKTEAELATLSEPSSTER